jgi:GntR family transcriptional regulator/MocR family aminotransferase
VEPVLLQSLAALSPIRSEPLAVQLYRDLLAAIRAGRLAEGGRLPSSRVGAATLGVSRNTVNAAYDLLRAEGAVAIRAGAAPVIIAPLPSGTPMVAVASHANLSARGKDWARGGKERMHKAVMAPGQPDEALFPRDEWARILRRQARQISGAAFGYHGYSGLPALRETLARRLAADRGIHVTPAQILITPGSQASLSLLALALTMPGDRALIEDPGYIGARAAFHGAGLLLHPLPVDGDGADLAGAPPARLAYLTPANQYPLGHRMSLPRREAAITYARRHDALIIEDDYDSEFLWRGRAIAAMQGMAPDLIITLGTVSKSLMPGLRLGWMVVPEPLAGPLADAQRNLGMAANLHAQSALADLIDSGRYRTHLARISHRYAERGAAFATALATLPGVDVTPPDGGVQLAVHLTKGGEAEAVTALNVAGFGTAPLSDYCLANPRPGLVAGFADATPERIAHFVAVLAAALGQATNSPPS